MNTNQPLVSVIIPNYNHAVFLEERFHSVLNQTYQNFELIILDDASTDNSLEIIKRYSSDSHVSHVVLNKENSGSPFKQWDKGMSLAKGKIVWIAESDDSCENTFLEEMISVYLKDNSTFCFCRSREYSATGAFSEPKLQECLKNDMKLDGNTFIKKYLSGYNIVLNTSSCIFDRKKAQIISKQYQKYRGAGDWMFWIEMAESGRVFYLNKALNFYRQHGGNTTKKMINDGSEFLENKEIFDYLATKHLFSAFTKNLFVLSNYMSVMSLKCNEEVREKLFNYWGWDKYTSIKVQFRRVLYNLHKLLRK